MNTIFIVTDNYYFFYAIEQMYKTNILTNYQCTRVSIDNMLSSVMETNNRKSYYIADPAVYDILKALRIDVFFNLLKTKGNLSLSSLASIISNIDKRGAADLFTPKKEHIRLSSKEVMFLRFMSRGATTKQIAQTMSITEKYVYNLKYNLKRKYGVDNVTLTHLVNIYNHPVQRILSGKGKAGSDSIHY